MNQYEPFVPSFNEKELNYLSDQLEKLKFKLSTSSAIKKEINDALIMLNKKREAREAESEAREAESEAREKATRNWNMTPGTYLRESVKHVLSKLGRKKSGGRRSCKKGTRRHSKKKGTRRR
jgi:hypothetical protein